MKWIKNLGICLLALWAVDSCIKEPSYSITPQIELQDLYFKKGSGGDADTLVFKLKFTDGDGDLGVGSQDSASIYAYNPFYWKYNPSSFSQIYFPDTNYLRVSGYIFLNYKARKLPQFDTLPDINCKNWTLRFDNSKTPAVVKDTIYVTQNLKAFNISVDVYEKVNSNYQLFNPASIIPFPGCNPNIFRATFPDLSSDRRNSPLEGTITFRLESSEYYNIFKDKTLKMVVTINDRAYHVSNPATKQDFTLQQITR